MVTTATPRALNSDMPASARDTNARPAGRRAYCGGCRHLPHLLDKLSGTSTREQRPGLAALLDYAREGDAIVVVGIDRLGRNAAEVMTTIRELGERGIVLRSLREGIDTSTRRAGWWLVFWLASPSLSWS